MGLSGIATNAYQHDSAAHSKQNAQYHQHDSAAHSKQNAQHHECYPYSIWYVGEVENVRVPINVCLTFKSYILLTQNSVQSTKISVKMLVIHEKKEEDMTHSRFCLW